MGPHFCVRRVSKPICITFAILVLTLSVSGASADTWTADFSNGIDPVIVPINAAQGFSASGGNGTLVLAKGAGVGGDIQPGQASQNERYAPSFLITGDFTATIDASTLARPVGMTYGVMFSAGGNWFANPGSGGDIFFRTVPDGGLQVAGNAFTTGATLVASESSLTATFKIARSGNQVDLSYSTGGPFTLFASGTTPGYAGPMQIGTFLEQSYVDPPIHNPPATAVSFSNFQISTNGTFNLQTVPTARRPMISPPSTAGQLLVFDRTTQSWSQSALPQQNQDTIVITAGWNLLGNSGPDTWPLAVAKDIAQADAATNIVTWDWHSDAALAYAGMLTQAEGTGLSLSLQSELPNYSGRFHFIGHSLGSLVNRQAIDGLATTGIKAGNIKDTILDAPEHIPFTGILPPGLASTNSNPIPTSGSYTIDNFITSFGGLHSEAENVFLQQGLATGLIGGHSYAEQWYDTSITNPGVSVAGFGTTPNKSTFYLQSPNVLSPLNVDLSNIASLAALLKARDGKENLGKALLLSIDAVHAAIQIVGDVVANIVQKSEPPTDAGTSTKLMTPQLVLTGHAGSYAWLPITIPADAQCLAFNTDFVNVPAGDSLVVGIGNNMLYSLDGAYASDGVSSSVSGIDISQYAGNDVDLFIGLFPGGLPPNSISADVSGVESVTVDSVEFVLVPEPTALPVILLGLLVATGRHCRHSKECI